MTSMIVKAGLAVLVALGGVSANAATAAAAPELLVQVQYSGPHGPGHRGPGGWGPGGSGRPGPHHPGPGRPGPHHPRPPQGCAPWFAQEKAARFGLRRARVVDVSRRVVVVSGFGRRGPERLFFANRQGCPLLRR